MSLNEIRDIADLKVEALTEYANFCIKYNEVPREELIIAINSCNVKEGLKKIIEINKSK